VGIQAASGATNYGQLAAWGLGALGAVRFVLPHLAGGWLKAAAVLGGALVGNIAWKTVETEVRADKAGSAGHVGTIAGGAIGGFLLGRSLLGDNPAGWLAGGITAAGAWLGHKLYASMNRPWG
jgi:outer membrane lipoprotein SlyB